MLTPASDRIALRPAPKRLLIVEDNVPTRQALASILVIKGVLVFQAATVKTALMELKQGVDTLLIDLMLPDGSGLDVIRAARKLDVPPKIIVTTGASEEEYLSEMWSLRPDHVFPKPIALSLLFYELGL